MASVASETRTSKAGWLEHPAVLAVWCMAAAFGTYACMYGFRKPFTAASYTEAPFGPGIKTWLVTAQVIGYTLSKVVGIRVVAELPSERRANALLGLIGAAQLAWVLFAFLPPSLAFVAAFLGGLPLGMVFGLVLGFLEGRRLTEAFVAGLCSSFILADGIAKTVGAALLDAGVGERWMPAAAGSLFLLPLVGFIWMLRRIPPPTREDVEARSSRSTMNRDDRVRWLRRHGLGIALVVLAYLLVTVLRSLRADFAPELWSALGAAVRPDLFTRSELWVTLGVIAASGSVVCVRDHRRALSLSLATALAGLALAAIALVAQSRGWLSPFGFMVILGLGLYLPYVAVHTTVFERLIALTRDRGNLAYLMYLADAAGYLAYVAIMLVRHLLPTGSDFFGFFRTATTFTVVAGVIALGGAWWRFMRTPAAPSPGDPPSHSQSLANDSERCRSNSRPGAKPPGNAVGRRDPHP